MFLQITTFSICHLKRIDGGDTGGKKKTTKNMCKQQHVTSKKNFPMKYPGDTDVSRYLTNLRLRKN